MADCHEAAPGRHASPVASRWAVAPIVLDAPLAKRSLDGLDVVLVKDSEAYCRICGQKALYVLMTSQGGDHSGGQILSADKPGSWIRLESGRWRSVKGRKDGRATHVCGQKRVSAYWSEKVPA